MSEESVTEEKGTSSIEDDIRFWVGGAAFRKLKRRFYLFSLWSVLAFVVCAAIILAAILWHVPGSADTLARLFAVDVYRENFPKAARMHSYLAQRYEGPWDIFLPAILMINIAACSVATLFSLLWLTHTPLKSIKNASSANSQLIERTRSKASVLIFFLVFSIALLAGIVSIGAFGWGGSPTRDFDQVRRSFGLLFILMHLLIMFIPPLLVFIALLFKLRRMLIQLEVR